MEQPFCGIPSCSDLICIIGPRSCGKTSLLFQHALACCMRGNRVMFACPKALDRLPLYHTTACEEDQDSQPTPPPCVLERLKLRYPSDLGALQSLFDSLHLGEGGPWHKEKLASIIVDDFHKYISTSAKSHESIGEIVRACAHMVDAVNSAGGGDSHVQCVLSAVKHPALKVEVIQKWFPHVLLVDETGEYDFSINSYGNPQEKLQSYSIHKTENFIKFHH